MLRFINNQLTRNSSEQILEKQTENKSITQRSLMCFSESWWVIHLQLFSKQNMTVLRIQHGKAAIPLKQ